MDSDEWKKKKKKKEIHFGTSNVFHIFEGYSSIRAI